MEPDKFLALALKAAADVVGSEMDTCTYTSGGLIGAQGLLRAVWTAFGALGDCVKPVVGGGPRVSPKGEEAVEGFVRAVVAHA